MFNCLTHNNADVAFVNLSSLMNIYPGILKFNLNLFLLLISFCHNFFLFTELIGTIFRVICLNESITDSHHVDQCYSAKKSLGSVS